MNAFLDLAKRQTPASVKARRLAAEQHRVTKREEKALAEREDLFRLWRKWRKERLDELLAGTHSEAAGALVAFLKVMTLADGARLVEHVRAGGWEHTDADTKFEVLSLINATITTLRERAELPPFDDGFPGDKPTVFLIIKEMLR
jgi:hypothetical protein